MHAGSLSSSERGSPAATAAARAARAGAMDIEATAADTTAEACHTSVEVPVSRKHEKRDATGASTSAAELVGREEAMEVKQKQRKRRAKMLVRRSGAWHFLCSTGRSCVFYGNNITLVQAVTWIVLHPYATRIENHVSGPTSYLFRLAVKIARIGRDRDRALLFRGWSRLCLHAASLSAPEGVSAAATAVARAARARALELEATAAAGKDQVSRRAAAVSAEVAASKEQAQQDGTEREQREEAMEQVDRQGQERRAKALVSCTY